MTAWFRYVRHADVIAPAPPPAYPSSLADVQESLL